MKTCDPHGQTWMGPKSRKSAPVTCGNPRRGFLCRILGRVGRRRDTVTCRLPDCAPEGRPVFFCSLTLAIIHTPTTSMCLTTRRDRMPSMEELIERIEEAAYYFPSEWFEDAHKLHAYAQGMISGRAQALRILRGELSQRS